jgi:hypothetical protein
MRISTLDVALCTKKYLVFRDEFSAPNLCRDVELKLDLRDDDLTTGVSGSALIDSATLCQFLNEAEQEKQEAKQERGVIQPFATDRKEMTSGKDPI